VEDLYPHVRAAFYGQPWAIERAKFDEIHALLQMRSDGRILSREAVEAAVAVRRPPVALYDIERGVLLAEASDGYFRAADGGTVESGRPVVAVIGIYGTMLHRATGMAETSGLASTEKIAQRVRAAAQDPSVRGIVLDVDSPGGSVYGVTELAAEIRAARKQKPLKAVFNARGASAAYWAASAADELLVTASGEVGSIGVFYEHEDRSEENAKAGRRYTTIAYGENKAMGGPNQPLSDAARENIEARVREMGATFEDDVAKNRGVTRQAVHKGFGQGLMFGAADAIKRGMVDRVGTLEDGVRRAARKPAR
jgi:capsid assembly protease